METREAVITPIVTIPISNVDSALISGLTPNRIEDHTRIGSVVAAGPEVKDAITKSSSDSVKASNHPEITAGAIFGNVTS